ncbi:uncharacterized protein LOC128877171 [Hylaeus volcanicus]|uniref:uncharacterized protein LOC128877171 n=1 Tax=Hylaeus volcanicus TaxID=313075 RepID=UPI0023B8635F|nr:uncharacterized protein LOC128877171 [Hylaeus volcanicus]
MAMKTQRPGLFQNTFPCVERQETEDLPDSIVHKVNTLVRCLQKCCAIESVIGDVKDVMYILEECPPSPTSERLQTLSFVLKEITKNLACCNQSLEGEGTFCCKCAQLYNTICEEWALQQSISGASKDESSDEEIKSKYSKSGPFADADRDYARTYPEDWKRFQVPTSIRASQLSRVMDYYSDNARSSDEDKSVGIDGSLQRSGDPRPAMERSARGVSARRRAGPGVPLKKAELGVESRRSDKFDGDLTKTLDKDEEGSAGKMRKIKRVTGKDPNWRQREVDEVSGSLRDTDESGAARSRTRGRGTAGKRYDRNRKSADDEEFEIDDFWRRKKKSSRGKKDQNGKVLEEPGRRKKLYRNAVTDSQTEERVGKMDDTEDEGRTAGQRGRKKSRRGKDDGTEEMADTSESKGTRGRRKKNSDAFDSRRKGTSSDDLDEEETALKGDGKRRGRSSGEREGTDSDLMRKRKGGKARGTSAADKSTLDSESHGKKETNRVSKKKERRLLDSSRTDDDYSKINGSRYRKRNARAKGLHDVETDHRSSIEYQLSDQHFVEQGWTVLPIAKTMRKIVQYQAKPAKPHLNWFKKHGYDGKVYYNDGSAVFLNFRTDGSGQVFYPNGELAIDVCGLDHRKYDMCTVFTPGGKDSMGVTRRSQIVAMFDTTGSGAVFDQDGATRLSYNQIGGIWRDNPAGPPLTWKWDIDEKESIVKIVYEEKPAAHLEKLLRPALRSALKRHDLQDYPDERCHLKAICMKLTDYVSLRILNRRNINLQFLANGKSIRIELGTILDFNKEVGSYFVDTSSKDAVLGWNFDKLLSSELEADSSLYKLANELREVKKAARQRKLMIAKYKPYLHSWKSLKTRCRPW